jgi:tetratricopeptide (TPR) repeat protein
MTDEQQTISGEAGEHPEPAHGAGRRWLIATIVTVVLVVYPATRWMLSARGTAASPAKGQAELQLSFEHFKAGRYQDAIASAKAALQASPDSADAYNNLAVSYLKLGMYDEGIVALQNAIRIKPDYQLARNNLAWIQQEKAKAAGQPGRTPSAPADDLLNQSLEHSRAGRFRECMETAKQSVALNPRSGAAFNNIGFCAANLQLWDEAIVSLQEALRVEPGLQIARNNLAWAQQQKLKTAAPNAR